MKKTVVAIAACIATSLGCHAQTYLETLQKDVPGQGSVTVIESKEIDDLVNGTPAANAVKAESVSKTAAKKKDNEAATRSSREALAGKKAQEAHAAEATASTSDAANATVDTSRKIMRGTYKTTGYRVQAFSGGNSRDDKNKAYEIGEAIKRHFPSQPVYVHFYSPRWTCRIGNYRTYEEASQMLSELKAMGYTQSSIVKGKIIVQ